LAVSADFLRHFDTTGWLTGIASNGKNLCHSSTKDSLVEHEEEETEEELARPGSLEKR